MGGAKPWRAAAPPDSGGPSEDGIPTGSARRSLPLRHAVALGLLHGPTELLPISSSGHTALVPWLLRWPYGALAPEARKSFEVALHAGTAAALSLRPPSGRLCARASFVLPAIAPPALAGYVLGGQVERRLGTPATIAVGLLAGTIAMTAGERRGRAFMRPAADAGALDGLALGIAQALALMPGVSRSGAAIAAARSRGFSREEADRLSWAAGLPVIAGAALLKGIRLTRGGTPRALAPALALGGTSAFLSTLLSTGALRPRRRAALLPACTAYRAMLALLTIRRVRDNTRERRPRIPKK